MQLGPIAQKAYDLFSEAVLLSEKIARLEIELYGPDVDLSMSAHIATLKRCQHVVADG